MSDSPHIEQLDGFTPQPNAFRNIQLINTNNHPSARRPVPLKVGEDFAKFTPPADKPAFWSPLQDAPRPSHRHSANSPQPIANRRIRALRPPMALRTPSRQSTESETDEGTSFGTSPSKPLPIRNAMTTVSTFDATAGTSLAPPNSGLLRSSSTTSTGRKRLAEAMAQSSSEKKLKISLDQAKINVKAVYDKDMEKLTCYIEERESSPEME